MPQVPTYGPRHVDTRPLPGVLRGPAPGPDVYGAQFGETLMRVGVRGVTEALELRQQASAEADALVDVQTQNQLASIESTLLRDPRTGALLTTGPATLDATHQTLEAYDAQADQIGLALTNDRQRLAFTRAHLAGRIRIQSTLDSHSQGEMRRWGNAELTAFVGNQKEEAMQAAAAFGDPARAALTRMTIGRALASAVTQIATVGPTLGMGPAQITQAVAETRSTIHAGVVEALLAQNRVSMASIYFEETRDQISGPVATRLTHSLASATTAQTGLSAAEAIWAQYGPKAEGDPIELDTMETAARAQFRDDPQSLDATIKYLRERKGGVDAGRKDRQDAVAGSLWAAVNAGMPLAEIQQLPAYRNAPGALQLQVSEHVVARAESRADRTYALGQRARAAAERQAAATEQENWAAYWHYNDPQVLSQMSTNEVLALTPTLGQAHVNRLLTKQREYAGDAAQAAATVRAATIDSETFKSEAQAAGYHPFKPSASEAERARLGQLQSAVETAIDQEQRQKKRLLAREEKVTIMRGILDREVLLDQWGSDPRRTAATVVSPTDQHAAYVPVAEIPDTSLTEWVSVIRKQFPSEASKTRAEILARWRDRIQRAHAAAVLGLGAEEELRRLQGR